ncbi:hypothetical protein AMATHDRAFT_11452 [Amanita thiersii Skay4041]|uniref:Uncharacterized protein n=1 Tax=Amanita thiersii Skay4041 TaxID=703135 RepID=A0A2A9NA47_9AGAR|nr:hypothetical protein AMATHDRAFT_11452 [Amanita thiersii Skay4041]
MITHHTLPSHLRKKSTGGLNERINAYVTHSNGHRTPSMKNHQILLELTMIPNSAIRTLPSITPDNEEREERIY